MAESQHLDPVALNDQVATDKPIPSTIGQSRGDTPAISDGGPLHWPENFVSDCTQALIRAATSTASAVIYQPDGQIKRLPYATIHQNALAVLSGLQSNGLQPGDTLLIASNVAEVFLTGMWAAILGGYAVSAIELPDPQADPTAYQRLDMAVQLLKHPPLLLDSQAIEQRSHIAVMQSQRLLNIDTLLQAPGAARIHTPQPEDTVLIILTSGSTGIPKGVMQSHRAILSMVASLLVDGCKTGPGDVMMNWLPRDHVGAMAFVFMGAVAQQINQVHADVGYVLGQPERWLQLVDTEKVSVTWSPNFAYELLARAARATSTRYNLGSMRAIFNGGEAVNEQALLSSVRDLAEHGLSPDAMIPAYGMSETGAGISMGGLGRTIGAFTSLGHPAAGSRFRVVDDNLNVLTEGEIGNIHIESPQLFTRYFGQDASQARVNGSTWFDTGDAGFIANGELYMTGRIKDTLNVRGVTLFAHELENTLARIPGIDPTRMAVTPVQPPGADTEEIAVFFSTYPASDLDDDTRLSSFISAIHQALRATHAVATHFLVPLAPSAFPLTPVGKIIKKDLRKHLETGHYDAELSRAQRLANHHVNATAQGTDNTGSEALDPAAPCIAGFIAHTLEVTRVAVHDDFFLIGGDSISATRLAAELSEWFFTEVPAAAIFQYPTPNTLAGYLRARLSEPELFETIIAHLNQQLGDTAASP